MKNHSLCLGLFLGLVTLHSATAAVLESFESATVTPLNIGDATHVDSSFFTPAEPPPLGNRQLLLTTLATNADGGNLSGSDAVSIGAAESFLGLQSATIPSGGSLGDASAVKLTLTLSVGDIISFQYRFLTSAEPADGADFAFYTLQFGAGTPTLTTFANITGATAPSASALFNYESGTATVTLPAVSFAGSYALGFGIADHTDDAIGSGVLIDHVQVVPEPSSALLFAAGLVGGAGFLRRRAVRI